MSLLKSMLFGYEGSYNVLGIPVTFEAESPSPNSDQKGGISQFAKKCLNNSALHFVTQTWTHTFVHEMGHGLASNLFPRQDFFSQPNALIIPEVKICTTTAEGKTENATTGLLSWKKAFVCAAGPLTNGAFSACKLVAAQILKNNYVTWPIGVAFELGAIKEMTSELQYAYDSLSKEDDGDFGLIAREGILFLGVAGAALITECALGALVAFS